MSAAARERALGVLGSIAAVDVPVAGLTTYRVGGRAAILVTAESIGDLVLVAEASRVSGLEVVVVGRGSNMLVADAGFGGIMVAVRLPEDVMIGEADDPTVVTASASVALPVLARRTAAAALSGFEWAVGVPGSVGGAVRMNAGGHGSDMAATLVDVDVVDVSGNVDGADTVVRVSLADLGLGFRSSTLADHQVVARARIRLEPGRREESEALIAEIVAWRRRHQPGGQNCGSVFVNPVPGSVSAGELIDGLGLRGLRVGTAHVSDKHANFILADEGGSADDVRHLMDLVHQRVLEATGYDLRSEVRLVGFEAGRDRPPSPGAAEEGR